MSTSCLERNKRIWRERNRISTKSAVKLLLRRWKICKFLVRFYERGKKEEESCLRWRARRSKRLCNKFFWRELLSRLRLGNMCCWNNSMCWVTARSHRENSFLCPHFRYRFPVKRNTFLKSSLHVTHNFSVPSLSHLFVFVNILHLFFFRSVTEVVLE